MKNEKDILKENLPIVILKKEWQEINATETIESVVPKLTVNIDVLKDVTDNKSDFFEIGSGLQKDINPTTGKARISAKSVDPNSGITEDRANQLIKDKVGSLQIGDKTFNNTTEAINEIGTEFGSLINDLPSKDDLNAKQDKLTTKEDSGIVLNGNDISVDFEPIQFNAEKLIWTMPDYDGHKPFIAINYCVVYDIRTTRNSHNSIYRNVTKSTYIDGIWKLWFTDDDGTLKEVVLSGVEGSGDFILQVPQFIYDRFTRKSSSSLTEKENDIYEII